MSGYNLHANTSVGSHDREGLERLTRYISRPGVVPDGRVVLELKRAWSDGTTGFVFTPSERVERLASRVPAPRTNTVVYHGVLAGHARLRSRVVSDARGPSREPSQDGRGDSLVSSGSARKGSWPPATRRVLSGLAWARARALAQGWGYWL